MFNLKNMSGLLLLLPAFALSADLAEIRNYKEYSPIFSSAGQPSKEQLELLKAEGFERVAYIAFSNSRGAVAEEDAIVKELGMDYVQVPVIWDAPRSRSFGTRPRNQTSTHLPAPCSANRAEKPYCIARRITAHPHSLFSTGFSMKTFPFQPPRLT